jgi:hypothetical protein
MNTTTADPVTMVDRMPLYKRLLIAGGIMITYLIVSYFLIGFKPEQVFISGLFFVLYTVSKKTRNFVLTLMPFIVFWVIFDYMKAFPNFKFNTVHIGDLYVLEKKFFGVTYQGTVHTWNEYWDLHRTVFLDVLNGFFYLCWMPVPISFGAYLFTKNRRAAIEFCLTFLLTNFVGFIGYYGYPAAPPWYIHYHGMAFNAATPGNVAGLAGFDNFFGVSIFHGLYAKSSNVFAAMPSLHAAYVVVSVFYAFRKNVAAGWKAFLVIVMLGTWFAAIYTNHHYIFDVLVGILCAVIGITLFQAVLLRFKGFNRFINGYYNQVK